MTVHAGTEGAIIGLKDSSGDDGNFRYASLDLAEHKDVFLMTGSEIVVDNRAVDGRARRRPGLANVDPHGYVRLWDAAQRGDWAAARKEQERLCRLFEIVWVAQPRSVAARPAWAASRPPCAASASSTRTSWRGRSAALNDDGNGARSTRSCAQPGCSAESG